eukprot:1066854-Amphidinium_carterae.1
MRLKGLMYAETVEEEALESVPKGRCVLGRACELPPELPPALLGLAEALDGFQLRVQSGKSTLWNCSGNGFGLNGLQVELSFRTVGRRPGRGSLRSASASGLELKPVVRGAMLVQDAAGDSSTV